MTLSDLYSGSALGGAASGAQQQNLQSAIAQMRAASSSAYQQHIQNLDKALSYYGPAQQAWDRAYGTGTPATVGQGSCKGTGA